MPTRDCETLCIGKRNRTGQGGGDKSELALLATPVSFRLYTYIYTVSLLVQMYTKGRLLPLNHL